mmetsp:Transcript_55298/g.157132  ORF Transcript_55298/g.157132 Transcript_55298/m.157132 type:complete len:353 (+) Transcript_55298:85-1143(+)
MAWAHIYLVILACVAGLNVPPNELEQGDDDECWASADEFCSLSLVQKRSSRHKLAELGLSVPRFYDHGLSQQSWLGDDTPEYTTETAPLSQRDRGSAPASDLSLSDTGVPQKQDKLPLQILGLYNSGTNLLTDLLTLNLPGAFSQLQGTRTQACQFWKHSSLRLLSRQPSFQKSCRNVIGIAMIRNPMSWLRSFHRIAYDLHGCKDGPDWLTRPCVWPGGSPSHLGGVAMPNVEDLWNQWVHDYEDLSGFGFDHAAVIRYEDLVLDTEASLQRIAALAGQPLPAVIQQEDRNMAPTGKLNASGRALSVHRIESRAYMEEFTHEEVVQACARLDREAMQRHGYTDCDDVLASR